MADPAPELILYVQSRKTVTTFYRHAPAATGPGFGPGTATSVGGAPTGLGEADASSGEAPVYFLSDDQSRALALTEELAHRRGYGLKVVDVEKAGRLERLVTEHLRGVTQFPVLVSGGGQRLVGCEQFNEENLAALMPTELKTIRALSYLKVKGGDLDRIRRLLEGLTEVKELHFLTGDWDILVVLEFPPTATNRRRGVLDFVTERIRGIPEILDTSTLVPEYSVTKFP
ncbi:MAG TPA: Lrp/AsnC ligand binding domain-containing protein [Thermoplasmata archaeon]|nr:Lrp/AsnC ligand binding domain-containing protein [Thermoplasmata archaeon]